MSDHTTLLKGSYELLEEHINNHLSDINRINSQGKTLLYVASQINRTDVVDLLISKGANVNMPNGIFSESALFIASERGNIDVVDRLLMAGADANIISNIKQTAIMMAARNGHLHIVKMLTLQT